MTQALLLDEMHSPVVARALRERGFDVIAVAEADRLRSLSDAELCEWAVSNRRRIVTENVKDFAPLLHRAVSSGDHALSVLFTSSRSFPRSRRRPGLLIEALDAWLRDDAQRPGEDWLIPLER